jgi:hypothetical protein
MAKTIQTAKQIVNANVLAPSTRQARMSANALDSRCVSTTLIVLPLSLLLYRQG